MLISELINNSQIEKEMYNARFSIILLILAVIFRCASTYATEAEGTASLTLSGPETVAVLTTKGNVSSLDFGSFRLGQKHSTIRINLHFGRAAYSTTGDIDIVEPPSNVVRYIASVAPNRMVNIEVGNGSLVLNSQDKQLSANQNRAVEKLDFTTTYHAYVPQNSSCTTPSCTPDRNEILYASGVSSIRSDNGKKLEMAVAGTLNIPANAKYGRYTGSYPITVTY